MTPLLPRAAVRLGFLSLAPLVVAGLVCLSSNFETARLGAIAFSIYAAALLSFLGGVRCGFELMRAPDAPDALRLLFSALPTLAGWAYAVLMTAFPIAPGAAAAFAGIFAAQNIWDARSAKHGAPAWYPMLRQVLTGGVMIVCLLLPFAGLLRQF